MMTKTVREAKNSRTDSQAGHAWHRYQRHLGGSENVILNRESRVGLSTILQMEDAMEMFERIFCYEKLKSAISKETLMQSGSEISKDMLNIISSELDELETSEDVRVLFAVESGSRAWGFASSDSDYDVRFVYARKPAWYMRLDKTRGVIEWKLDDVLDISGWDIQKALRLMRESNPSLMEWLSSPIFYRPSLTRRFPF